MDLVNWLRYSSEIRELLEKALNGQRHEIKIGVEGSGEIKVCDGFVSFTKGLESLASAVVIIASTLTFSGRCVVIRLGNGSLISEPSPYTCAFLDVLDSVIVDRLEHGGEESYTRRLAEKGVSYVVRKVGEEAVETMVAALSEDATRLVEEVADLVYHMAVMLRLRGLSICDVCVELKRRHEARRG